MPAPEYEPSAPVETPAPGSSPGPSTARSATSTAPAGADRHEDADDDDEDVDPHIGVAAGVDALITLYEENTAPDDVRSGRAFAFLGHVAYDFDPYIRAFVRYGIVDNFAPGRSHAASLSNLLLGGSYGADVTSFLRVAGEGGLILPTGTGGGRSPPEGIAIANARARTMPLHPAMFDPSFITPYVGGIASSIHRRIVGRFDAFVDPSFKVNDARDDTGKTRLRTSLHGGYRVLPWLEPFVEVRYFRFLSARPDDEDPALVDNLFAGIGAAAQAGPLRAQIAYLRASDPPLTRIAFNVFAIRVGAEF